VCSPKQRSLACARPISASFRVIRLHDQSFLVERQKVARMEPVDKPRTEKAHTFLDLSIDAPRSPVHEGKNQEVKCNIFGGLTFLHAMFLVLYARIFASISVTLSFLRLRVCA